MPKLYAARRPFDYTDGVSLDQGQVFKLTEQPNDEVLIRLGFCAEVDAKAKTFQCRLCGGKFTGEPSLNLHGRKRHPKRERDPVQEDAFMDKEDKRLAATAPLYMDKTKATAGEKPGRGKRA